MTLLPGTLDPAFADAGVLNWDFPEFASIAPQAVLSLPDGKLIAVATEPGSPRGFVVARLTEKGRLDVGTGFGEGQQGFVRILTPEKHVAEISGASLLSDDGMLIIVTYIWPPDKSGFIVVRLLEDGRLNNGFGKGGVLDFPYGAIPATLSGRTMNGIPASRSAGQQSEPVVQGGANSGMSGIELPDKKIALASFGYVPSTGQTRGLITRLNPDGSFDKDFNQTGSASVDLGIAGDSLARGVAAHTEGGLLVYGDFHDEGIFGSYAVRFTKDGAQDNTFKTVKFSSDRFPAFYDVAVRKRDGIIVLAGGQAGEGAFHGVGIIFLLKGDGSNHPLFNNGQPLIKNVLPETGQLWTSCAFGGKDEDTLIVSGTSGDVFLTDDTHAVCARYSLTGELDTSFNGQGWVIFDQSDRLEVARDMTATAQNRIVICGDFHKDRQSFANSGWIARYLA
jgi:uncharacterized delta-60 repeat protein